MRIINLKDESLTLKEAMEEFLDFKKAQKSSELTIKDYRTYLMIFLQNSKGTLEAEVLKGEVREYFMAIPDTSPARYNHPFQYLNAFFNWSVRNDYLQYNPITKLGLKKKHDGGKVTSVRIEEVKALLKAMDCHTYAGLRDKAAALVMLDTGMRPKEMFSLKHEDIDFKNCSIHVKKQISKTRTERIVYLSNETVRILRQLLKVKPETWGDLVFTTYEGKPFNVQYFDKQFRKYSEQIGVKITPYQLRHTFATIYLKSGGDVFSLQKNLGHSDLRMTKRYIDLDEEYLKEQHAQNTPLKQIFEPSRLKNI